MFRLKIRELMNSHTATGSGPKVEVAEKKAKKGLKMAVEILGRSGEGDHTQSVYLVRWMNTRKKRNGTHYCR